jgi:hypothetical protein
MNHFCPHCGFKLDPDNPSQPVCPACGCDPQDSHLAVRDRHLAAVLEDVAAVADADQSANKPLDAELLQEPDTAYTPDSDLDFAIGEAETLRQVLVDAPFLVPGNRFVN